MSLHITRAVPKKTLDYWLLDVFTDTPLQGNPLAVFPEAAGLETDDMQRIARELNLSETVFITAHTFGRAHLRIFTPGCELPFAGHPTIGTACLLRALGWHDGESSLTLVESIGEVPIRFEGPRAQLTTAQPLTVREDILSKAAAAQMLGLPEATIAAAPVVASCGAPYHLIALTDLEQLARAQVDTTMLRACCPEPGERSLYLYVRQPDNCLRTRMFAPLTGTPEDPATGSAAAPLAGFLTGLESGVGTYEWKIRQGVEMGRPSDIVAHVERNEQGVSVIRITGEAVIVGEGRLRYSPEAHGSD